MKKSPKATNKKRAESASKPKKTGAKKPKTAARTAPKPTKSAAAKAKDPVIPAMLLEDDTASVHRPSGPGRRYAASAAPPYAPLEPNPLPEAYGTKGLFLAARDPHWLYATWDLTREQQSNYNKLSRDRHIVLRVYKDSSQGNPFSEIHLPPASRNWFAHVGQGRTPFLAVLGYYSHQGNWIAIAESDTVITPPDDVSDDLSFRLETLPANLHLDEIRRLVRRVAPEELPILDALERLRAEGHAGLPTRQRVAQRAWTPEQDAALARVLSMDDVRRVWMGSHEITELVRRHLKGAAASQGVGSAGWSGGVSSLSSPYGGMPAEKSFWFNINAELIIYGATEPNATVTVDGKRIQLRKDGSFSFRFSLPDGRFPLGVSATSADGDDTRSAHLDFQRVTHYRGTVDTHPQDPKLKPPLTKHVA